VKLLLVDDNHFDRMAIEHLLASTERPFDVFPARDADEALVAMRSRPFDCILIDVHLPRQSGMQLMQQAIRQFGKNCPPAVLMTASNSRDAGVAALKGGADDFLNKDELSSDVLLSTILGAINKRNDEQERDRQEIESRMRSLGQLAAGIAHELNNPAAYIRVNLDLLEEQLEMALSSDKPPSHVELENQLRLVRECTEGLERMSSIVGELQSFTKSAPTAIEAISLDEVVNSSTRFLRSRLMSVGDAQIQLGGTSHVMANRRRMVQVVVNLLSNALDAADPNGSVVRVSTRQSATHAEVIVEDNGVGIPVHLRERVFEPFFTTKGPGRGTGLGLSLSAEYVAQAGGTLEVDGSALGGALFRVKIPLSPRRSPTPIPPALHSKEGVAGKATILAVDDEPNIRRAYARVLGTRYQVYTAGNGKQALDVLKKNRIDAIICDLAMPDMGGRDLLKVLRATRPDVARRVIFCTGGDLGGSSHSTTEDGNLVLSKPVSKFTLEEAIDSLLSDLADVPAHE
jgi:signal transduction histidine kinase